MYRAHYIRILIDELEEVLQTPTETLAETHDAPGERVVELLDLVVDVLQNDADYSHYGYDESSEGDGA